MSIRIILFIILNIIYVPLLFADQSLHITAMLSHDKKPYHDVVQGLSDYLNNKKQPHTLKIISNFESKDKILTEAKKNKTNIILALGQKATQFGMTHFDHLPICAAMLLNQKIINNAEKTNNVTVLSLEFSLETQITWLKSFLKNRGQVAVLYPERHNKQQLNQFIQLSKKHQLPVYLSQINNQNNISEFLDRLPRNIAGIWSFTSNSILSVQNAKTVLLYSFRNRIPVIGLSSPWVKAGALYALERDYHDIGYQSGYRILQLFQGINPQDLSTESPRKVRYVINLKTANHMKIDLSEDIIKNAYKVY